LGFSAKSALTSATLKSAALENLRLTLMGAKAEIDGRRRMAEKIFIVKKKGTQEYLLK
jgi:hypothetical protein